MNKIAIYTGAFGKNYGIIPQKKIPGADFFCFTDDKTKIKSPWKTIELLSDHPDEGRKNRHPKILPHLYFKDYDISVYIDSNYLIVGDIHELIQSLGNFKMAIFDHNQCDDKRDCVYDEFDALIKLGKERGSFKDAPEVMEKQIAFLKSENYPKNNGLIFSAVLVRKHNDPEVIKVMEDWWQMVSTRSKRDQLSFDYAAWKNNFKPSIISGDLRRGNPYFYFVSIAQKSYAYRLFKLKFKRLLGIRKY
ncbi:glycosyltransferase domain-containing protein [Flavobacterium sp. ASW18X]|uniref:glycosyltransferase domain-containing protein n=1 Tax=Flavobacterium sp. ASW18X TaxID=2572595 RepID=UPI0010AE1691|nr:glycosyltransferase domain-containing protein [Flavobacterium sp. ASW18X]TKD62369.1 DUF616 domain-containing protein [Flavobacterium sp. ASW18X]